MLSLESISLQYGGRVLFHDLSCIIGPHARIGLLGSNGAGKSTLLRMIVGDVAPDMGSVNKASYVTVGYLPQDGVAASGKTLYKEVESAFEDVVKIQHELEEAQVKLAALDPQSAEYLEILEISGELQHKLEDLDAFRMKSKVERVLMGLGFAVEDFERQTDEFSGGWQMRIALAKLLLKEPSLLLLDEPTNHLDIESLQWLEGYLYSYNGAIILVSHDRAFVDGLCTKTFALGMGRMEEYAGNYSFYERERLLRKELRMNAYKNQQQRLKQTQGFIDRFRYKATKARQVQSRIKQLEKMELIEIEPEEDEIRLHFPQPPPSGRVVMELRNVAKSYGSTSVFEALECRVERGDRIAIVGVNGAGKSTLSGILAGVEPIDSGERVLGYNTVLSYFAQHQAEELDLSKEVIQIVEEVAEGEIRKKLRTILGSFLFHGDDAFKKVAVLSGGEKSRLALAKMLLRPANFLIMDEPTNHLDMKSKGVLQEALKNYEGTYVIVSHDRAFLDPLVNKVLEVSRGSIKTYLGNVSDYVRKRSEERDAAALEITQAHHRKQDHGLGEKERKRLEAARRQDRSQRLRPLRQKIIAIEKRIERLESRKQEIEMMMANPEFYKNGEGAKKTSAEYKEVRESLEESYNEWNSITEEIIGIESASGSSFVAVGIY